MQKAISHQPVKKRLQGNRVMPGARGLISIPVIIEEVDGSTFPSSPKPPPPATTRLIEKRPFILFSYPFPFFPYHGAYGALVFFDFCSGR
jgi:hypothetical protein